MQQSESIASLAAALAAVQGEMRPAAFNAVNPFLKNKYADLTSIMDACRHLLSENGLSVVQMPCTPPVEFGPCVGLTTMLMHSSGEWVQDTFYLPLGDEKGKSTAQVAGSIITYARRYALAAMLGIVSDEDTDGNDPSWKKRAEKEKGRTPHPVTQAPSNGNGHKPEPNGLNIDARSWLQEKFRDGKTNLGMVVDAATMTDHYEVAPHAMNALKEFSFPDGFKLERKQTITGDGALKVFDWLIARKEIEAARNEEHRDALGAE